MGVHRPLQAGISGTGREGADSIVVSGGYADDRDYGDQIIYTGHGGRDRNSGRQIADQTVGDPGNAGLIKSQLDELPVRVLRGATRHSRYAPLSGYRYDGLYGVLDHWAEVGEDGFQVIRFRLERINPEEPLPQKPGVAVVVQPVPRRSTLINRQLRDSRMARQVKAWHNYVCQFCEERIVLEGDFPYAEAAHIKALGEPHSGPDDTSNMLCLCPNDHVRFDNGALALTDDFRVLDRRGNVRKLRTVSQHDINLEYIAYHRRHIPAWPADLL